MHTFSPECWRYVTAMSLYQILRIECIQDFQEMIKCDMRKCLMLDKFSEIFTQVKTFFLVSELTAITYN
jgi:hypothetical protein